MSLQLKFELRLEERAFDRVFVSVLLAPLQGVVAIEGVALQLVDRGGEPLSARMLLPIVGTLTHAMLSTVELRSSGELPGGSRVVGTAFRATEQLEAVLPTDPGTEFEAHMRGRRCLCPERHGRILETLIDEERERIARVFPWVNEPRVPPEPVAELSVVDSAQDEEAFEEMKEDLGLDEDTAEWVRDLMRD